MKNKTKLIKENSTRSCGAGPIARIHVENVRLA